MKHNYFIKSFTILLLGICLISCKKETDDTEALLIGKWNLVSTSIVNFVDNVKRDESVTTYSQGESIMEIKDNGTAERFVNGVISDAFYWIVEGDLFIMTSDNGTVQKAGFSINGTDLTLMWAVEINSDGHTIRSEYISTYKKL